MAGSESGPANIPCFTTYRSLLCFVNVIKDYMLSMLSGNDNSREALSGAGRRVGGARWFWRFPSDAWWHLPALILSDAYTSKYKRAIPDIVQAP